MHEMTPLIFTYQDHLYMRTRWMDENLKPVHVGVYERDYSEHYDGSGSNEAPDYCFWDGVSWGIPCSSPGVAKRLNSRFVSDFPALPWRGLTKPVMEKLA